jgi:glutamate-ammonia-ligase adenylyltransferase
VARNLCLALGTSPLFGQWLGTDPDLIVRLAEPSRLRTLARDDLVASSGRALAWRAGGVHDHTDHQRALHRWRDRHLVGVAARDVFGVADVPSVGADLTVLAEAVLERAVTTLAPRLPFAVVALGRLAGSELSYASDLDVVFVHEATTPEDRAEALRLAAGVLRFVGGTTPAQRIYAVDAGLRPEGRDGPLSRTLDGYATYFARWAQAWERQAMARARPVAGDRDLGERFAAVVGRAVWGAPFTVADEREVRRLKARVERERVPLGEDREFHLKLGPGALADVEWTVQLLQLRTGTRAPGTMAALAALEAKGAIDAADAEALRTAYRLCEATRNRWYLVGAAPAGVDALPTHSEEIERLARSLGTSPAGLRGDYRRATRRCRRVVDRLFYGAP